MGLINHNSAMKIWFYQEAPKQIRKIFKEEVKDKNIADCYILFYPKKLATIGVAFWTQVANGFVDDYHFTGSPKELKNNLLILLSR